MLARAISSAEAEQVMASSTWTIKDGQTDFSSQFDGQLMVRAHRVPVRGIAEIIVTESYFVALCTQTTQLAIKHHAPTSSSLQPQPETKPGKRSRNLHELHLASAILADHYFHVTTFIAANNTSEPRCPRPESVATRALL